MKELASQAVKVINSYKSNKEIMDFVTGEALEKTASDIREKKGSGITAKGVDLLRITNKKIESRVQQYVNAGLIGCYMASIN